MSPRHIVQTHMSTQMSAQLSRSTQHGLPVCFNMPRVCLHVCPHIYPHVLLWVPRRRRRRPCVAGPSTRGTPGMSVPAPFKFFYWVLPHLSFFYWPTLFLCGCGWPCVCARVHFCFVVDGFCLNFGQRISPRLATDRGNEAGVGHITAQAGLLGFGNLHWVDGEALRVLFKSERRRKVAWLANS